MFTRCPLIRSDNKEKPQPEPNALTTTRTSIGFFSVYISDTVQTLRFCSSNEITAVSTFFTP